MLKKLRIKFVAVTMTIVTTMLILILCLVYFFTKTNLESESLAMMRSVAQNPLAIGTPYDESSAVRLPYFIIMVGEDGDIMEVSGGYYDLSDEGFLNELIEAVSQYTANTGVIKEYNLRFYRADTFEIELYVFSDVSSENATLRNLMQICILIGVVAVAVFLGLSMLLARWMVRPVEEAFTKQQQFMSDASHELKTPLTVITTNAELLNDETLPSESRHQLVGGIVTMSHHMRALVEQLLDLTRSESNQDSLPMKPLNLSDVVQESCLLFEPTFFEQGLPFFTEINGPFIVNGHEQSLRQVMDILLDNARKYAAPPRVPMTGVPPQGYASVRVYASGRNHVRLAVTTSGIPLTETQCLDVFRRFYRTDQARGREGGFGLGLPIAESLIHAHHGRIWAESAEESNTFYVELELTKKPHQPG